MYKLPDNYFVDDTARIGTNVHIGKFVSIHNGVKIGNDVKIEDGAVIYEDCDIGNNSVIAANCVLRPKTIVGHHTILAPLVESDGECTIGNYTTIHAHSQIAYKSIIGNCCFLGSYFMSSNTKDITDDKHGTSKDKKNPKIFVAEIEDFVRTGIRVTMTPGLKIGHHSLIYQNSLITKDIPPYSIVKSGKDQVGKIIGTVQS